MQILLLELAQGRGEPSDQPYIMHAFSGGFWPPTSLVNVNLLCAVCSLCTSFICFGIKLYLEMTFTFLKVI
jgi:hypothetical protein